MSLYESDLFINAKAALEKSFGVRQAFELLPENAEILITLDDRIPCTLKLLNKNVVLEPHSSPTADLHLILFSESIRRFKTRDYDDLLSIAREILTQVVAGHAKVKVLISPTELHRKGYLDALKKLGPEFQKVLTQNTFTLLGHAQSAIDQLKSIFKR